MSAIESETILECVKTWDDFNLKEDLLRGIYAYGFENPSDIQKKAIIPIIQKKDVIAQAQSGSGKTGAFTISALQLIDTTKNVTQCLIIAPTHELAKQTSVVIKNIGSMMPGLTIKTLIGGTSVQEDAAVIRITHPHVIIGTCGRIYDMIRRNYLKMDTIDLFILDEADEMLSKGFKEQIYNIFQGFHNDIQVVLFSATLPQEIIRLSGKFMRNPVSITMKAEDLSLECIHQSYVLMKDDNSKFEMLKNLFSTISVSQCIIYCNSIKRVTDLSHAMNDDGFSVCAIHSSMDKGEREAAFINFRNGGCRVLISSDITARGIDIQQVNTVINFDIPKCYNTYLHRIGRSGRWGRKGNAINFVTKRDVHSMRRIEEHYKINITELQVSLPN
jgi:translation initiation factor 4A